MATIRGKLQSAAAENTRLCQTISETEYAISAHQQSTNYVHDLKKQIAAKEKELAQINHHVAMEYKDHRKYRDSHMKRLAYKLGGKKLKFEEEATKEEKEWLDAVAMQLKAKKGLEVLNTNLMEATKSCADLQAVIEVHNHAQVELDALYKYIFDGPTPEIPEEDVKENEVGEAEQRFNAEQLRLSMEKQARAILGEADMFLKRAFADIQDAKDSATMDAWGVGGTFAEMSENNALSRCQQHVSHTEMLISQAQRVQPAIRHIGDMRIAQMDFLSNVVFDNIFSDMAMRDRITDSMRQLTLAQANLQKDIAAEDARVRDAQAEVNQAKSVLDRKREELQRLRAAAFERLAHGEKVGEARPPEYAVDPPAYQA